MLREGQGCHLSKAAESWGCARVGAVRRGSIGMVDSACTCVPDSFTFPWCVGFVIGIWASEAHGEGAHSREIEAMGSMRWAQSRTSKNNSGIFFRKSLHDWNLSQHAIENPPLGGAACKRIKKINST
jgi:hypothetical protein